MTYWQLVRDAAGAFPHQVVVTDDYGRALTTTQLRRAAEQVAAGLPIGPGTVVSWQLPTTLEAVVLMAALARVGAVQNPIIPTLREREVAAITRSVGTELFVTVERWRGFDHAAMARGLGLDVVSSDLAGEPGAGLRLPSGDPAILPPEPGSSADDRWRYFSSGTTADPKGARHSDASVMASAAGIVEHLGLRRGDRYPVAWPLTHIGGITMLTACLRTGGSLVLFDTFDPTSTPGRMAVHRATVLGSAQPFFRAYVDAQHRHGTEPLFPDLRLCTAGGAPTPPELVREVGEALGVPGIVQSYGLTEFPVATCARADDPPAVLAHSAGSAAPGVEVRVVDGEVRLRGPQCFAGYVDPALDRDAFDAHGWFRTGDLGSLDADGNLSVTGRLKDVIISNAENVSALEVEDVILRHPAVAEVAVIGLPDPRTGERVVAVVVPVEGASALGLPGLREHCRREGLAVYKLPADVRTVAAIPRNPMGKALKEALRAALG